MSAVSRAGRSRIVPAALALAAVAVASLTTGCSSDAALCGPAPTGEVSQADLYGSYAGPHGVRLTLTNVGDMSVTFTVKNWPRENQPRILEKGAPSFNGGGTWELLNPPGEDGEVGLDFENLDNDPYGATVTELLVGKEDGRIVLFAKLGDPDVCRVFTLTS